MPLYRIHLATTATEQFPPIDSLLAVEADDPVSAVEGLLGTCQVPREPPLKWARVVISVHDNGQPHEVVRVPIEVDDGMADDL